MNALTSLQAETPLMSRGLLPEAAQIAACQAHTLIHAALCADDNEDDDTPLSLAHDASCAVIDTIDPGTIVGCIALARVLLAEARNPDGTDQFDCIPDVWVEKLIRAVARLNEPSAKPTADAELIAACDEYCRMEAEKDIAWAALDEYDDEGQDALSDAVNAARAPVVERIVALRATTPEGILARGRCRAVHYIPGSLIDHDDPTDQPPDRFMAADLRDLVAMQGAVA